jgi:hypothetical protein
MLGVTDGESEGDMLGPSEGDVLGPIDGPEVGAVLGPADGEIVGVFVGDTEGWLVGPSVAHSPQVALQEFLSGFSGEHSTFLPCVFTRVEQLNISSLIKSGTPQGRNRNSDGERVGWVVGWAVGSVQEQVAGHLSRIPGTRSQSLFSQKGNFSRSLFCCWRQFPVADGDALGLALGAEVGEAEGEFDGEGVGDADTQSPQVFWQYFLR